MAELTMNVRIEPEDIANRVLDEFEYKGKTIREWADCLSNPKTNADRIRNMSDEELAEWISYYMDCQECEDMNDAKPCHNGENCGDHWLDRLKQEVDE